MHDRSTESVAVETTLESLPCEHSAKTWSSRGEVYVSINRERWKQSENPADQRVPLLMGLVLLTSLISLTISLF